MRHAKLLATLPLVVITLGLLVIPAGAHNSPHSDPYWTGLYFNNPTLSGVPTVVRQDAKVDFDWGAGSPHPSIPADNFSVRWFRTVDLPGGRYRFFVTVDDGVRLWVDGVLLIDKWLEQAATTYSADIDLYSGRHLIVMEYYERYGVATAKLWWETPPIAVTWKGEYFNNRSLSGAPVFTRCDSAIDFDWGQGSPDPRIPADSFSVRWTGDVYFDRSGYYTFYARTDDGVKIWLDSSPLIAAWWDQPATTYSVTRYVSRGVHRIEVNYYENTGFATIKVWWRPVTPPSPPGAAIIVDELDPGFTWGGPWRSRHHAYLGYKGHMYWTRSTTYVPQNYAIWKPSLPHPSYYEVFFFIPRCYATTHRARYRIFHNGQRHDRIVNQAIYYDKWVSLGTYYFNASGNEFVFLGDNTREPYLSRYIGVDAMKFVPK
ncbi:MAG: hypothetical protein DRI61_00375 [Chloroflexi bacterium]|nr:MAG: hypothetical protein DRI61_00375 [Chloroflexota bacterium]